jgi:hypothetical protein
MPSGVMHEAISLLLLGITQEGTDEGLGRKFASLRIWDVHEGTAAKCA